MKATFFAIALIIGGAFPERPSDQDAVMRVIESAVELPAGAQALEDYSRNYAMRADGKVIAIYVTPLPTEARGSDYGCEVMLEDFGSRPCTEAEEAEIASNDEAMAVEFGQAGQSCWFDDYRDLPVIDDGGCSLIEIIFNPPSQLIESTRCNGEL